MASNTSPRFQSVVAYLYCADAPTHAAWLERVFGFEMIRSFADKSGLVRNIELRVGACEIWLDHKPEAREKMRGVSDWIGVYVDNVDDVEQRARAAGVEPKAKMDRPWGVRELQILDVEGYCWGFLQRIG